MMGNNTVNEIEDFTNYVGHLLYYDVRFVVLIENIDIFELKPKLCLLNGLSYSTL